jgi:DNA-binding transcriptional MerR regulator
MDLFSISQLAQYSGIKPHTIRIWEQRYNALQPVRSEGNTRYYDSVQLRRLLNIVSLSQSGHKVSDLGILSDAELFSLLETAISTIDGNDPAEYFISQMIATGMAYDEANFERCFSHCLLRFGMKNAYIKVLHPMLERIGLMWSTDKIPPAQEHFISNLVRRKLFTAIEYLPVANSEEDAWLLFLPENEFHEIGLLFSYYLVRLSGKKAIYLGSNVPQKSVLEAVKDISPKNLLFFLVHNDFPDHIQAYLNTLADHLPDKNIFFTGNPKLIGQLEKTKHISWVRTIEEFDRILVQENV